MTDAYTFGTGDRGRGASPIVRVARAWYYIQPSRPRLSPGKASAGNLEGLGQTHALLRCAHCFFFR